MAETATATRVQSELRAGLTVGRRSVSWWLGRLVVDEHQLVVRSLAPRFIAARSAAKREVGDISVRSQVELHLPVLHWRRIDIVRFRADGPLADVSLKFPRRRRVAEVFRAHGYSVTRL